MSIRYLFSDHKLPLEVIAAHPPLVNARVVTIILKRLDGRIIFKASWYVRFSLRFPVCSASTMGSPEGYDHEKPSNLKTLPKSDVDAETTSYSSEQQRLALKQHWSAYFTILAAAFGLISDGCKCSWVTLSYFCLIFECRSK